jgi:transposase, IS5 family
MLNRFRLHRALEKLVDLARRHDVPLRLSYRRLAKRAALTALEERFADLLALGVRVRFQDHRQRGRKVYALHAPEVECIGKGKARAPYEFGYKVSVATPATKPKGGQFVLHAKALHGNPFDGHTLEPVIAELEALTGIETRRIRADKGYRGHNHTQKFRVWISGQVRRVSAPIRREMRRRAAVEPVTGHIKAEHHMGRNYLKGHDGDRINPMLAVPATTSLCSCAGSSGFCTP